MNISKIAMRLTQLCAVIAATIVVDRPPLPQSVNACNGCESPTQCKGGLLSGATGCEVKPVGSPPVDRCSPFGSGCGS